MFLSPYNEKRLRHLRYAQRLLAFRRSAAKDSGEFSYPPFVDLVERWETLPSNAPLLDENDQYPWGAVNARPVVKAKRPLDRHHDSTVLRQAIAQLQQADRSTDLSSIQQAILHVAQESRYLEAEIYLVDIDDAQTQATIESAVSVMRYTRLYLMSKYSTSHFIRLQGSDAEQSEIDQAHRDRCFNYLAALNDATHLLEAVLSGTEVRDGLSD